MTEDHHCQQSSTCITTFRGFVYIYQTEMGRLSLFSKATTICIVSKHLSGLD